MQHRAIGEGHKSNTSMIHKVHKNLGFLRHGQCWEPPAPTQRQATVSFSVLLSTLPWWELRNQWSIKAYSDSERLWQHRVFKSDVLLFLFRLFHSVVTETHNQKPIKNSLIKRPHPPHSSVPLLPLRAAHCQSTRPWRAELSPCHQHSPPERGLSTRLMLFN